MIQVYTPNKDIHIYIMPMIYLIYFQHFLFVNIILLLIILIHYLKNYFIRQYFKIVKYSN